MPTEPDYCALLARAAHEPLIGTASRNACHFVLAVPKTQWLPQIKDMDGAAGALAALIDPLKDQAMLSLRHCPPEEAGTLWLFPHGLRFDGLTPEDYPALVAQAMNGDIRLPYHAVESEHVVMICTHGKRDASCARFGYEVYRAFCQQAPATMTVWEITHIGGHRFAGTLIVQPANQWYGFLDPAHVPDLIAAIQNGGVLTSHYRGNASYPPPLQAAEGWGWEQIIAQGGQGTVSLLNPKIEGSAAQVTVALHLNGTTQQHRLTLAGEPYEFIADTGSTLKKDRLIWRVVEVNAHEQTA